MSHWPISIPAPLVRARALGPALKRALDVVGAFVLLAALAPVLAIAAVLVRLTSPGPAFFRQERVGHGLERFRMLKLRTMRADAEAAQDALALASAGRTFLKIENDPRVTAVGRWLRRTSLDELPQLVNVLKGDMSLVGPRPLLGCDLYRFPVEEHARRFAVKPGMTGLWQVSGRSLCTDDERMRLDLAYVDNWSLWLDLEILVRTIPAVLTGRGAS